MPYEIELSPRAAERLDAIDPILRGVVVDHLYQLAESPTTLSRPSGHSRRAARLPAYDFDFILHDELHRFVILFKYAADEATIWVYSIGYVHTDLPTDNCSSLI